MMTVVLDWKASDLWIPGTSQVAVVKGAPVEVVQKARYLFRNGNVQEISEGDYREITAAIDRLADQGFRLLGLAVRPVSSGETDLDAHRLEEDLTFVGLIAILDPPRPGVPDAIRSCRRAGIRVTMVTGDYGLTARAVAREIGLLEDGGRVISGRELDQMSEEELHGLLQGKTGLLFARVTPEHKLRLVQAYKAAGQVVAVTGDGVNDAPALRAAHIGIAMGISGTDVAREAADIVLTDDNFATIVGAVEQGRAIYNNIRKFITYILASNMAEAVPFIAMALFKIPPALTIMQILAIDLGTDMIPALALGAEWPEAGLMAEPPRRKRQPILDRFLLLRAYGFLGLIEALGCMGGFLGVWWSYGYSMADLQAAASALMGRTADPQILSIYQLATTVALASIVACQDGNLFACRSERTSILRLGFFTNHLIWIGIVVEWGLILSIIYFPPLAGVFETSPLTTLTWLSLLIWPVLLLSAEEVRKWVTL
jgi:Ca2+-transporting ATPase